MALIANSLVTPLDWEDSSDESAGEEIPNRSSWRELISLRARLLEYFHFLKNLEQEVWENSLVHFYTPKAPFTISNHYKECRAFFHYPESSTLADLATLLLGYLDHGLTDDAITLVFEA